MKEQSSGCDVIVTYTDRPGVPFSGRIRNCSNESLRVTLAKPLMDGATVSVEFSPGCAEQGTVGRCHADGDCYSAAIHFRPNLTRDARTEERVKHIESVVVFNLDGGTKGSSFLATTTDISPSGLGLHTPEFVPMGSLVRVESKDAIMIGEIRHSKADADGRFRVGIALERRIPRTSRPEDVGPLRKLLRKLQNWR